jgi:hypothetical protein
MSLRGVVIHSPLSRQYLVYNEITVYIESHHDSVSIDDICIEIVDRTMVDQAISSLVDEGKVMRRVNRVYWIA